MPQINPLIKIITELGIIKLELYETQAPLTVRNFLSYVQKDCFKNGSFYRTVRADNQQANPFVTNIPIEVIQGGLGMNEHPLKRAPIKLETSKETGLKHKNGTISMARLEPDSAQSEFFICIGDQTELDYGGKRNPDGLGFAAFGQVTTDMEIVKKIQQSPAEGQWLEPAIRILTISLD